ncbi:Transcriptional regulator [Tulasnella sp. 419]|nr:Transcriptional regulator [Tulasnella sp. 419]
MEVARHRTFQQFKPPLSLRSLLLHNSHEHQVPHPDELASLHEELLVLKSQTDLRIKTAEADLAVFGAMYKRTKDREKALRGKLKNKDREKEKDNRDQDRDSRDNHREIATDLDRSRDREKTSLPIKVKREYSGTPDAEDIANATRISFVQRKLPNASAVKAAAIKAASLPHAIQPNSKRDVKLKNKRKRPDASDDDADSIDSDLLAPPPQRVRPSPQSHSSHASSGVAGIPKTQKHQPGSAKPLSSTSGAVATSPAIATHSAQSALGQNGSIGRVAGGHSNHGYVVDFTLPPKSTLPPKPVGIASAGFTYTKMPVEPKEVTEDFSDRKAPPNQIPTHTFWKEVETWMKPVGEEDVAWLEFDADDAEPFLMPVLGRHYTEVWDEEDTAAAIAAATAAQSWPRGYSLDRSYSVEPASATTNTPVILQNPYLGGAVEKVDGTSSDARLKGKDTSAMAVANVWDARTIAEPDLVREEKGLGPLTERIVSAFLLRRMGTKEDDGSAPVASKSPPSKYVDVLTLETKIRNELQTIGLLSEEEPDFNNPLDDDVASALRRCQALLRQQRSVNSARKNVLLGIARDRLAFQDYLATLEGIERGIISGYQKMLKVTRVPKKKKDKEKSGSHLNGGEHSGDVLSSGKLILEPLEALMEKVRLRQRWLATFGVAMEEWEKREAGRLKGLPQTSIYSHLGDTPESRMDGAST